MQILPLFSFVSLLRSEETAAIESALQEIEVDDREATSAYLELEYAEEQLGWAAEAPAFDPAAATWAAEIVYIAAQLIIDRQQDAGDLDMLFAAYEGMQDASAILSADLMLRFLPDMLTHLKLIDTDDVLIPILESLLGKWHFSGIKTGKAPEGANLPEDPCLRRCYLDRIIQFENLELAMKPELIEHVRLSLGNFADFYWKKFDQKYQAEEAD